MKRERLATTLHEVNSGLSGSCLSSRQHSNVDCSHKSCVWVSLVDCCQMLSTNSNSEQPRFHDVSITPLQLQPISLTALRSLTVPRNWSTWQWTRRKESWLCSAGRIMSTHRLLLPWGSVSIVPATASTSASLAANCISSQNVHLLLWNSKCVRLRVCRLFNKKTSDLDMAWHESHDLNITNVTTSISFCLLHIYCAVIRLFTYNAITSTVA